MDRFYGMLSGLLKVVTLISLFLLAGCVSTEDTANRNTPKSNDFNANDAPATEMDEDSAGGQDIGGSHKIGGFDPQPEPDPRWLTIRAELAETIYSIIVNQRHTQSIELQPDEQAESFFWGRIRVRPGEVIEVTVKRQDPINHPTPRSVVALRAEKNIILDSAVPQAKEIAPLSQKTRNRIVKDKEIRKGLLYGPNSIYESAVSTTLISCLSECKFSLLVPSEQATEINFSITPM